MKRKFILSELNEGAKFSFIYQKNYHIYKVLKHLSSGKTLCKLVCPLHVTVEIESTAKVYLKK